MLDVGPLVADFRAIYGSDPRLFAAPGRVNLIGEHTDYNDGFVLPLAIERETVVAARARDDRRLVVRSRSEAAPAEIDLDRPGPKLRGVWYDYVEGVARALEATGLRLTGADLLVDSDVPLGAGLSSSAALEISIGKALAVLSGHAVDPKELAKAGLRAEHEYVGTQCGIMDQFISALAEPGHALLVDCRSLASRLVPVDPSRALVMISDSRVKHSLASSEYNTRRAECEAAVRELAGALAGVRALRDVSVADLEQHGARLEPTLRRRARHVVTENARTSAAADALAAGDLPETGRLMYASHASLRDDYEVSAPELDALVEAVRDVPGVYGARMTGGGFGGCTVTLLAPDALEAARDAATRAFAERFGKEPVVFVTRAAGGAREVVR
jgi:galactokinase